MSITTIEQLETLAEGTSVHISTNGTTSTWTRGPGGLRPAVNPETVVPIRFFAEGVAASDISMIGPYEVGQWRIASGYHAYVVCTTGEGGSPITMVYFRDDGMYVQITRVERTYESVVVEPPEWANFVERMARSLVSENRLRIEALNEANTLRSRNRIDPDALQRALHEYLDDIGESPNCNLERIMERYGMEARPALREDVTVTVEIEGYTDVDFNDHDARAHVGNAVTVGGIETTRVDWTLTWEPTYEEDEGDCACGNVGREDVRQHLDFMGVPHSEFDWESTCSNC